MPKLSVVVPAAGRGTRMQSEQAKQYLPLLGKPVLVHTLQRIAREPVVEGIVLVVAPDEIEWCRREIVDRYRLEKIEAVVAGGEHRQDSVLAGVLELAAERKLVAVHDGARPLLPAGVLDKLVAALQEWSAVITAVPVTDTIKQVTSELRVAATLDRQLLWNVQTPQAFRREVLVQAHQQARRENFRGTDDAALVERLGVPVQVVMGSYDNIKITNPPDLRRMELLLRAEEPEPLTEIAMRTGFGYDVHTLVEGRALILGGVAIPWERGLLGHSDADVLVHAVMDALLGAVGQGDIGQHFPDSDPRFAGISSLDLLRQVGAVLTEQRKRIINIDCLVVAQRPRLAPYRQQMQQNLAAALEIPETRVNVKATTTEGLGFAGREEGIAAYAISLVAAN